MKLIFLLAHATLFFRGVDATERNLSNNPNNDADDIIHTIKLELMQVQSLKKELMQKSQNLKSFSLGKMGAIEILEKDLQELKADNMGLKKDVGDLETDSRGLDKDVKNILKESDLLKEQVTKLDRLHTDLECDVDIISIDVKVLNSGWWDAAIVKVDADDVMKLGICQGGCDNDDDCAGELICIARNVNEPLPTGCLGLTYSKLDFCGRKE